MSEQLLLADIGNTCIKLVFARPDALEAAFSLPTRAQHTADSLGLALMQLLSLRGITTQDITACVLCSVVPDVSTLFQEACRKYLGRTALTFPGDFVIDMVNGYDQPQEVGADRLLAAYAARKLFPEPSSLISVDFGTATTFDCVSGNTYLGGLICPGLFSSRNALATNTAKLPRISLEMTDEHAAIGRNTITSMNHGFLFGFAAMTENPHIGMSPVALPRRGAHLPASAAFARPTRVLCSMSSMRIYRRSKNGKSFKVSNNASSTTSHILFYLLFRFALSYSFLRDLSNTSRPHERIRKKTAKERSKNRTPPRDPVRRPRRPARTAFPPTLSHHAKRRPS